MRLIDADALIEHMRAEAEADTDTSQVAMAAKSVVLMTCAVIEKQPTIQPEIIHCKDCRYSIDEYGDGECYCKRPSRELVWIGKRWDFFCAAAKLNKVKDGGERMRMIDKLQQMSVDEFAEWYCIQMWDDYKENEILRGIRFHEIRNFLLMEVEPEKHCNADCCEL